MVGSPEEVQARVAEAHTGSEAVMAALPERGERSASHRWVFAITVAFLGLAGVLRCVLEFEGGQRLFVLALLAVWLVLVAAEPFVARVWPPSFAAYLAAQGLVVFNLLIQSKASDTFALLLAVPVMQAMQRWRPRSVAWLIAAFALLTGAGLLDEYTASAAIPLMAIYCAGNVFFAAYALASRRAVEARARNEALSAELRETNQRLADSAEQAARLGAARERVRLARDLHDSVTQTLFSMTLTVQSALLLLGRRPSEVAGQLDQMDELTHSALDELRALGEDAPLPAARDVGLVEALERHLTERKLRDGLSVRLEVDGDGEVPVEDEQALLRIVQESLNNVVKHAGVGEAVVRLRLRRPFRLEVEDRGRGFDARESHPAGLGLTSMEERAVEIGWSFMVTGSPGHGTLVVAEGPGEETVDDEGGGGG